MYSPICLRRGSKLLLVRFPRTQIKSFSNWTCFLQVSVIKSTILPVEAAISFSTSGFLDLGSPWSLSIIVVILTLLLPSLLGPLTQQLAHRHQNLHPEVRTLLWILQTSSRAPSLIWTSSRRLQTVISQCRQRTFPEKHPQATKTNPPSLSAKLRLPTTWTNAHSRPSFANPWT